MKPIQWEAREQMCLIQWARRAWFSDAAGNVMPVIDFLFSIPNGGSRNEREARKLKAQGVKAGVSDLCLPIPRNGFHGAWIEMKAEGGRVSALQLEWGERMTSQGYFFAVCIGWRAAAETISSYLGGVITRSGKPLSIPPPSPFSQQKVKRKLNASQRTNRRTAGGKNQGGHPAN